MRPGPLVRSVACAPLSAPRRSLLGVVCRCVTHSSESCAAGGASATYVPRASLTGGALPCGLPLGCAGPPLTRPWRVVGSTCGSVALLLPCECACVLVAISFLPSLMALVSSGVCTPCCPGGILPLLSGVAFGVPRVPRGYLVAPSVSQSSVEPVSVDIYLHPLNIRKHYHSHTRTDLHCC